MPKTINGVKCRTREESLKHIIKRAKANKIGPNVTDCNASFDNCQYQYPSGNNCAVGSLFSKAQLKNIQERNLNSMSIGYATTAIGLKNIQTVTGMTLKELQKLQTIHDKVLEVKGVAEARKKVIEYCQKELEELAQK